MSDKIYKTIEKLNAVYKNIDRSEMTFDEEVRYVNDCYNTMELYLKSVYESPFTDYSQYNGKPFRIVRRMSLQEDNVDISVLPKWIIAFDDGVQIEAYPEEICNDMSEPLRYK